jgi:nicotinamide-nucleotide amidase
MTGKPLEKAIGELLLKKKMTVSVAESCTGGLVSSKLTDVSGSSAYITLNVITYSNDAKVKMLGVPAGLIAEHGAVSEPVAAAMSQGVMQLSGSDIGVGITGIAGPTGGTPEKPVGLVYIGITGRDGTEVHKVNINPANLSLPRTEIKQAACHQALSFLLNRLEKF